MKDDCLLNEHRRTYVLDTNVLLSDPDSITSFAEHNVIIPMVVLEELDRHKGRSDEVGKNARSVSRMLDNLRAKGSLLIGVQLPSGGSIRVEQLTRDLQARVPFGLEPQKVDNLIIASVQAMSGSTLVSKDVNVRVKCDGLGIRCEDYRKQRVVDDPKKIYKGVDVVDVDTHVVDEFYRSGSVMLPATSLGERTLFSNQIVVIRNVQNGQTTASAITKCVDPAKPLVGLAKIEHAFGLKPRNKEQSFALDLLFDESVRLLTLTGQSGCGKTLLALAAGLEQLKSIGGPAFSRYDKLIVTRPVLPVGRDIGFLPGTLEEKMEPWIAPIRDNLNFLVHNKRPSRMRKGSTSSDGAKSRQDDGTYLSLLQERGLVEIEAITFIRGRSIPNAFIIIDEAQNLSMHELKTIITRVGDGTKIILTGDIEQIDNVRVDAYTNGLTYAVERFKEYQIAGHITLTKGERSALATLASKIL